MHQSAASDPEASHFKLRRIFLLATAAAVVIFSAVAINALFPPTVKFPGDAFDSAETFRDHMAFFANSQFLLDHNTSQLSSAKTWLDDHHYPSFPTIPERIVHFKSMGCKAIDWGDHRVGLVSVVGASEQIVHLFIIARSALLDLDSLQPPFAALATHRELQTGGWLVEDQHLRVVDQAASQTQALRHAL